MKLLWRPPGFAAVTCAYMSQKHPDLSILTAWLALSNLHKHASDSFLETCRLLHDYRDAQDLSASLISEDVRSFVSERAAEIDSAMTYQHDFDCDCFGFKTPEKSYLLRVHGNVVEPPDTC